MTFHNPEVAPFARDTWPYCEPWERAGVATLADRLEVEAWARNAQLGLQLELDRRFDRILARIRRQAWPGVE